MLDLDAQPVLFIPDVHFGNLQRAGQVREGSTEGKQTRTEEMSASRLVSHDFFFPSNCRCLLLKLRKPTQMGECPTGLC